MHARRADCAGPRAVRGWERRRRGRDCARASEEETPEPAGSSRPFRSASSKRALRGIRRSGAVMPFFPIPVRTVFHVLSFVQGLRPASTKTSGEFSSAGRIKRSSLMAARISSARALRLGIRAPACTARAFFACNRARKQMSCRVESDRSCVFLEVASRGHECRSACYEPVLRPKVSSSPDYRNLGARTLTARRTSPVPPPVRRTCLIGVRPTSTTLVCLSRLELDLAGTLSHGSLWIR